MLGLLAEGMFPIPLDPRLTAYERERILAQLEPDLVVEDEDALARLPRTQGPPRARPMHVTSGTTGTPKGVYSGLLDDDRAAALVAEERDLWGFAGDDVNLVLSPLYHSAPLRFAMGTALAGGRVVIPGAFDPERVTAAIESERPTSMFCVPTHLQRLFAHWDRAGHPRPVELPAGGARRRPLPGRHQAPGDRDVSRRHAPGSSTGRPRDSSPPAPARSG